MESKTQTNSTETTKHYERDESKTSSKDFRVYVKPEELALMVPNSGYCSM